MAKTEYEFGVQLREAFLERFDGIDKDDERNPDYEDPQYWQDDISELADSAVPIYTQEMYELWMALGRPEVDDSGLIEGVTDIDKIVATAIYCYATQFLYELANEYEMGN